MTIISINEVKNLLSNELATKVEINKVTVNENIELLNHSHSYYEIIYVKNGGFSYYIEETLYNITDKSIVLIKKDIVHKTIFRHNINCTYFIVKFYEDCIYHSVLKKCLHLFEFQQFKLENNFQDLIDILFSKNYFEYKNKEDNWEEMVELQLNELIIALHRGLIIKANDRLFTSEIEMIVEYIDKNVFLPISDISLNAISDKFFLAPYQLSRLFKKQVGIGFKDYVIQLKISYAKVLIASQNNSITDIAFNCGFNDSNYFSTVFKRVEGVSPSEYKKMLKI